MFDEEFQNSFIQFYNYTDQKLSDTFHCFIAEPYIKDNLKEWDAYTFMYAIYGEVIFRVFPKLNEEYFFDCTQLTGEPLAYFARLYGINTIPSVIDINGEKVVLFSEIQDIQGYFSPSILDNPKLINKLSDVSNAVITQIPDSLLSVLTCFSRQLYKYRGVVKLYNAMAILGNYFENLNSIQIVQISPFGYEITYDWSLLQSLFLYEAVKQAIYNQTTNIYFKFTQS